MQQDFFYAKIVNGETVFDNNPSLFFTLAMLVLQYEEKIPKILHHKTDISNNYNTTTAMLFTCLNMFGGVQTAIDINKLTVEE